MKSKITGGLTKFIFEQKILNKYKVKYYQCVETGFIQTEEPFWLEEAYSEAITKLDIGLLNRNFSLCDKFSKIISSHFDQDKKFLDYAGGYGIFTRLMRDKGLDFFHSDIYCKNIFAEYFEADLNNKNDKYEILTALELFEHMNNPLSEIKNLFEYSDNILFTTVLQPEDKTNLQNWWYFSFETGQHISLYNMHSLEYLARELNCNMYSDNHSTHLFTKKHFFKNPLTQKKEPFLIRKARKLIQRYEIKLNSQTSLLQSDFDAIKMMLNSKE